MTDRELLERVRAAGDLGSGRDAEAALAAVLKHLVARLSWREQHDLAWRLPPRTRRLALGPANTGLAYAPYRAFLQGLADELGTTEVRAEQLARAVAGVLAELLPAAELRDLQAELHGTYRALFA